MTFWGKIFATEISDDLLLLLFLVIDQIFRIFPFFSKSSHIFAVKCHISPFPHKKNTFFTLFILSRACDNTTSLNIGGPMHGPSPHLKFWGTVPSSPP